MDYYWIYKRKNIVQNEEYFQNNLLKTVWRGLLNFWGVGGRGYAD